MSSEQLASLEHKIDELIAICERLRKENAALRGREQELMRDKSALMQKNEQARSRVESMITRLKAMNPEL